MSLPLVVALMLQASPSRAWGQAGTGAAQSDLVLRGLTTVTIAKPRVLESRSVVDTYELATVVEERLRERGVPVQGVEGTRGGLALSACVASEADGSPPSISMTLSLTEEVELRRAPGVILTLPTWSWKVSQRGKREPVKAQLREGALQLADRFADAWERVHPTRLC